MTAPIAPLTAEDVAKLLHLAVGARARHGSYSGRFDVPELADGVKALAVAHEAMRAETRT